MTQSIDAIFDGQVLKPVTAIDLPANTKVRVTIEPVSTIKAGAPYSFLEVAKNMNLEGPPDWATNLDTYLYGVDPDKE